MAEKDAAWRERSKRMIRALATPERAARRLEAVRRFRAGESRRQIARALEVTVWTVTKWVQRLDPDLIAAYRARLAAERGERRRRNGLILRARENGASLEEIARASGLTLQRIGQLTRELGVDCRGRRRKQRIEEHDR